MSHCLLGYQSTRNPGVLKVMLYFYIVYRWQRGNSWISSCFNSTNKVHPTREVEPAFSSCQVQWGPACSAGQTSKRQQHHGGRPLQQSSQHQHPKQKQQHQEIPVRSPEMKVQQCCQTHHRGDIFLCRSCWNGNQKDENRMPQKGAWNQHTRAHTENAGRAREKKMLKK